MQVTVESQSSVKKILHIEIPQDRIAQELDKAYGDLKKHAKVKGFRPGKTPRSVLERLYKKDVHADVCSKLIQESFVDAIRETDLKVLGNPKIEPPELNDKEPYRFNATIEVNPELADIDFKGLTLRRTLRKVSDEEIEKQLQLLQKNLAYHKDIEEVRAVEKNDMVLIDYEGFKDGAPFNETQRTENFSLRIGDGQILKDFDDQLIGMMPGDQKEVTVSFPEDYFNPKLAHLDIRFDVTLKGIREQVLPPIDDDLAKRLGKYETLEDLKKVIVDNLDEGYSKRAEQELNEQIFSQLIERQDFEVPDVLIESELEAIIEETERSFAYYNKSMEESGFTREMLREKYRQTAEKQVKRYLLLSKLIQQENLEISDDAVKKGLEDMARAFNQPVEEVIQYYDQNPDKLEFFKQTLLEKQMIRVIINQSHVEDVADETESASDAPQSSDMSTI